MADALANGNTDEISSLKTPPHSVEAEQAVLGGLLLDNSVWVREYAREYLQNKWNNERKTCEPKDLTEIAKGQIKLENELTKKTD